MLAERGIKNPYDSFEGRLAPFMRARSRLTEDGSISFYSTSAEEVAQRALMESSQGSNEGEREFDALTRALGTREQRGRVRGVSSKLTWKKGFPEHRGSYRKRTRVSSSQVDIEEIKRELKMEMFGELKPIFESQGLSFPDLLGMRMSEERRSSFTSAAAGASQSRGTERPSVPTSVEPDTIDGLARPTRCSLLVQVGGSSRLEVGKGLVYPGVSQLDDVQVSALIFASLFFTPVSLFFSFGLSNLLEI
jgi:hypothetical protein